MYRSADRVVQPALSHTILYDLSPDSWFTYARQVSFTSELTGRPQVEALVNALNDLCQRHEALRTGFHSSGRGLTMRIDARAELPLTYVDATSGAPGTPFDNALADIRSRSSRPFDPTRAPLAAAFLHELGQEHHLFTLLVDHRVCDGPSLRVLAEDLSKLYESHTGGEERLPAQTTQYSDWIRKQRDVIASEGIDQITGRWRTRLGTDPAIGELRLPGFGGTPAGQLNLSTANATLTRPDALRRFARRSRVTLFAAFMGIVGKVVATQVDRDQLILNTMITSSRAVANRVVGSCSAGTMIRVDLRDSPGLTEVSRHVHRSIGAALADVVLPPQFLCNEIWPGFDYFGHPRLSMQPAYRWGSGFDPKGLQATPVEVGSDTADWEYLIMDLSAEGDDIGILAEFPDRPRCRRSATTVLHQIDQHVTGIDE